MMNLRSLNNAPQGQGSTSSNQSHPSLPQFHMSVTDAPSFLGNIGEPIGDNGEDIFEGNELGDDNAIGNV